MRHVISLVTGIVAVPVIWFLVALGQGTPRAGGWVLLGVGVVAGLIATLRTSPLGPFIAGLIFTSASVVMYLKHDRAMEVFTTEWQFREYSVNLASPLTTGVLAFAGGLLLVSMFSIARWRGSSEADDSWNPIPDGEVSRWPRRNKVSDPDGWSPIPAEEPAPWPSRVAAPEPEAWSHGPQEETYGYR